MKKKLQEKVDLAKRRQSARQCTRKDLLALDPATNLGWATPEEYGLLKIEQRRNESRGMKWVRFERWLREMHEKFKFNIIAYEAPAGRHINSVSHQAKLAGLIEKFCSEKEIECIGYNVSTIKKFATDNGNASKEMMIKAASERLQYTGSDDNEADALWILELLKSEV